MIKTVVVGTSLKSEEPSLNVAMQKKGAGINDYKGSRSYAQSAEFLEWSFEIRHTDRARNLDSFMGPSLPASGIDDPASSRVH
jgi:hypothetical protein